jgi:hypothetical protein
VLVERMAPGGIEMLVGARRDPKWGPIVAIGCGGVQVEILDDVRLLAPEATEDEILDELARLRAAKLLAEAPADRDAFADIVLKIAALMRAAPDLMEIDLNPVVVYREGVCALDALMVVGEPQTSTEP